jgi:hypothetical protein
MRLAVAVTAKYAVIVTSSLDPFQENCSISSSSINLYHISLYPFICSSIGLFPILSPAGKGIFADQKRARSQAMKYIPARVRAIFEVSIFFSEMLLLSIVRVSHEKSVSAPRLS